MEIWTSDVNDNPVTKLATFDTTKVAADLTTSMATYAFTDAYDSNAVFVVAGTKYVLVATCSGADDTNFYRLNCQNTGDVYAAGCWGYGVPVSAYATAAGFDAWFKVYVTSVDTSYGSDVITGGTPSADGEYGDGFRAPQSCDGNESTNWYYDGAAMPHWWKYDLGAGVTKIITKVRIKPSLTSGHVGIKYFKIQGSTAGAPRLRTANLR